jgi:hypothetical protein
MMVFFVLLTLGFVFELGKNALTIESRQTSFNNGDLSIPHAFISYSPAGLLSLLIGKFLFLSQNFCSNHMVKPHSFSTEPLRSDPGISQIITEISTLMPQLANFIAEFHTTENASGGIKVLTDAAGTMVLDVPGNISDQVANKFSTRIGIIDRLITTQGQQVKDLLEKGMDLENKLKMADPNYVSQLTDKIKEFNRLNSSYNH